MIEWLCTQDRWNPEVASIFGAAARYRRVTVGSSHDDVHPDKSELHSGAACPHSGFVESSFSYRPVQAVAVSECSICYQLFRVFRGIALFVWEVMHS
jgi:hypothetical protein